MFRTLKNEVVFLVQGIDIPLDILEQAPSSDHHDAVGTVDSLGQGRVREEAKVDEDERQHEEDQEDVEEERGNWYNFREGDVECHFEN